MDAEQPNQQLSKLLRRFAEGEETAFDLVANLNSAGGPDGKKLVVERRKLQPEVPELIRCESPARAHSLMRAEDLIAYVDKHNSGRTLILLDPTKMVGSVVLDEDDLSGFEVLTFAPTKHPMLVEWETIIGKKIPAAAFAEFILAHRRQVQIPDGKTLAMTFAQIRADKMTTIHRGTGANAINGLVVEVKVQAGGASKQAPVELPDSLTIEVPVFVGQGLVGIELDLLVSEQNDQVCVLTSSSGLQQAIHEAFDAMCQTIRSELPDEVIVGLGRVEHREWKYLNKP